MGLTFLGDVTGANAAIEKQAGDLDGKLFDTKADAPATGQGNPTVWQSFGQNIHDGT